MERGRMTAIVFDLDGTLIDSAPDIRSAANKMLHAQGQAPLDLATIIRFIGNGLPKLVERVIAARGLPIADHARLTEDVLGYYNAAPSAQTRPYDGVENALKALKEHGYTLGICTNKPVEPACAILENIGLMAFFDGVIGGDSLAVKKPDPAPLLASFAQLGQPGGLYVGDSEVDAETAARAGIPFVLFTEGYRKMPVDQLPHDHRFSEFRQLLSIVQTAMGQGAAPAG